MTTSPPVRIRISDTAVARVAAHWAQGRSGVLALPAGLGRTVLGFAGSVPDAQTLPAGASATVRDGSVEVALTLVTRLGHNCRDLAQAVQREVAAEVRAYTGLSAVVSVTIAEIVTD